MQNRGNIFNNNLSSISRYNVGLRCDQYCPALEVKQMNRFFAFSTLLSVGHLFHQRRCFTGITLELRPAKACSVRAKPAKHQHMKPACLSIAE